MGKGGKGGKGGGFVGVRGVRRGGLLTSALVLSYLKPPKRPRSPTGHGVRYQLGVRDVGKEAGSVVSKQLKES